MAVNRGAVPVRRLLCPNPGTMTGPGTNTYLVGEDRPVLVDPGPINDAHRAAILQALGKRSLTRILVTHTHGDHSPGAAVLQRDTGAELIGWPAPEEGHQDRSFRPDRDCDDGERIDCGGFVMRVIHTPGHVSNHLCFLLEEEGMLFTGDHVLQGSTSVILPPDGDMRDYLWSLERLRRLPVSALAPGHGTIIEDPEQAIDALIRHRLRREGKVLGALAESGPVALEELTRRVYDDVASHLLPWAQKTLLAHLLKLETEGRVSRQGEIWQGDGRG